MFLVEVLYIYTVLRELNLQIIIPIIKGGLETHPTPYLSH